MERKIGERFAYHAVILKVIEHPNQLTFGGTCHEDCYFRKTCGERDRNIAGQCQYGSRSDCKAIYFKQIKNEDKTTID